MDNHTRPGMSEPFRVALLSFSDGRFRVHTSLESTIREHGNVLKKAIENDPLLCAVEVDDIAYSSQIVRKNVQQARADGIEAAVFNIPVFAFPNYSLIAARMLELPVLLSSPQNGKLPGLGGIMAASGAMKQVGLKNHKLWGNPLEAADLHATLSAYCRASAVIQRMKGSVYGLFGGRSIGMNTGAVSNEQWMREFGIDVEHIDQLEIVRRAKSADEQEVERAYAWLCESMGSVSTEGKAAPEHVKEQIRHYIAMRSVIDDFGLDFVGLKCHYELSEYFVTGCLSAMFFNDPYDWNGPKKPIMTGCEADSDGALTMQILKLISGYPSLLFDVRSYDEREKVFVCCNCGAQPSWYAARSDDPKENLSKVSLVPVIVKYGGGGAHFPYICKQGEMTVARLSRENGRYRMFAAQAEFVEFPAEKMAETCAAWPHGYLKMNIEPRDFINIFNTNHAHVVPGNHLETLQFYCELMDMPLDLVR